MIKESESENRTIWHERYVDLMSDAGFKRVFGVPSNKDLLIALLSVLLPEVKIKDLTYIDKEKNGLWRDAKKSAFDVMCETDEGSKVMIEVQVEPQKCFTEGHCTMRAIASWSNIRNQIPDMT